MKPVKKESYKSRGFSMVELIVVLAVFMIIVSVSVSLFISIIRHQSIILAEQEMLNQASYVTEYMSRTIRSGIKDQTGSCIDNPGNIYLLTHFNSASGFYNGIKFITENNICQEFFLDDDNILKEIKDGQSAQSIFSDKFPLGYFRIILNGDKRLSVATENDLLQPRITFVLSIKKLPSQIAKISPPFLKLNYARADFIGIPVCGDGVCDFGEAIYCSNRCPLLDDCVACPPPPPAVTGLSCVDSMCISDFIGTDNCLLGTSCVLPPPTTGLSCLNNMCVASPTGIDSCFVGSSCGQLPPAGTSQQDIIIQATVSQMDLNIQ